MILNMVFQDREFVEMENPFNGAAKRPGSPSPLASPAHSGRAPALLACCARCGCCPQKYQVTSTYVHWPESLLTKALKKRHTALCLSHAGSKSTRGRMWMSLFRIQHTPPPHDAMWGLLTWFDPTASNYMREHSAVRRSIQAAGFPSRSSRAHFPLAVSNDVFHLTINYP